MLLTALETPKVKKMGPVITNERGKREWRQFLNVSETEEGDRLYRIYHTSFQDFLEEEVGLVTYHARIAEHALAKIPGLGVDK